MVRRLKAIWKPGHLNSEDYVEIKTTSIVTTGGLVSWDKGDKDGKA